MLGKDLLVNSYVVIKNGCPLAVTVEGPDHVQITCGRMPNDGFEFSIEHEAMRHLVALCTDTLTKADNNPE